MALHYAIRNKLLRDVRFLVEEGTDVNARDKECRTPLIMCCLEEDQLWAAGVARMLLQVGAKVGIRDKDGRNSLMFSSMLGRLELNELFLKAVDYDLNQSDVVGNTALHYSALAGNETIMGNLIGALLRSGLDINVRNRLGQTAAALALHLGHISCVELFRYGFSNKPADFSTKIPPSLLLRPWHKDLELLQNPIMMLKNAIKDAKSGANLHRSRPDLNLHQFRRGTEVPESVMMQKTKRKRKSKHNTNYQPSENQTRNQFESKQNNSLDFIKTKTAKDINEAYANGNHVLKPYTTKTPSWRDNVSDLMEVKCVQVTPSYRSSAVAVSQDFDDIFKEIVSENGSCNQSRQSVETEANGDKQMTQTNGSRRKSMMPSTDSNSIRAKIKADFEMFALQTGKDWKRRSRKGSTQVNDLSLMQRRKTAFDRLPGKEAEHSSSSSGTGISSKEKTILHKKNKSDEAKRRQSMAVGHIRKKLSSQQFVIEEISSKIVETPCSGDDKDQNAEERPVKASLHKAAGFSEDQNSSPFKDVQQKINGQGIFRDLKQTLSDIVEAV
ncbi:uncharacterized protein LOC143458986 [Clavelina lepadiformis]|uniref:uncharacterized protein LOC143458986 n=1 Tax=Clavelina lepadiformis TaxID=159417 RepID=UPI004041B14F